MKKLLIASSIFIGLFYVWRRYEYKQALNKTDKKEGELDDTIDDSTSDVIDNDDGVHTISSASIDRDGTHINTKRTGYNSYYTSNNTISNATKPVVEVDRSTKKYNLDLERERKRRNFEDDHADTYNNEHVGDYGLYTKWLLRHVNMRTDPLLWDVMSNLIEEHEYLPSDEQIKLDESTYSDIKDAKEKYFDCEFANDSYMHSPGELLLYIADKLSSDIGCSRAGILEILLTNGGFISDGKKVDDNEYNKAIIELERGNIQDGTRSIFGKDIFDSKSLPICWMDQINLFEVRAFDIEFE